MKILPVLSKMLNDVETSDIVELNDEEVKVLSEEIELVQKSIGSDIATADEISSAINDIEASKEVVSAGLESDIDINTAKAMVLGLMHSVRKLDYNVIYEEAGLQSDNPKALLTAGLQSADSIISKAKEALKKIWESIKNGVKWIASKIKEILTALFNPIKNILKKQRKNKFMILTLKEAQEFLEKNKDELQSSDPEAIKNLKDNFIKTLKNNPVLSFNLKGEDVKKEIDDFIASAGFLQNNTDFVNFMLNVLIVKKNIDKTLNIRAGNDDNSNIFMPINIAIYEFSIIDMIASNGKSSESISQFLKKNDVNFVSQISRGISKDESIEKAFESAIKSKIDDISKKEFPAILIGDAGKYIDRVPELTDRIIEVYSDINHTLEKIIEKGASGEDIAISDLKLTSDSFIYANLDTSPLAMKRIVSVDYINLLGRGSISLKNKHIKVSLTLNQLTDAISSADKDFSTSGIYKKIEASMDRLEKSYSETIKNVDKIMDSKEFGELNSRFDSAFRTLFFNLTNLAPYKGVKYFQNVGTSYKNILDTFDISSLIKEEFSRLEEHKSN